MSPRTPFYTTPHPTYWDRILGRGVVSKGGTLEFHERRRVQHTRTPHINPHPERVHREDFTKPHCGVLFRHPAHILGIMCKAMYLAISTHSPSYTRGYWNSTSCISRLLDLGTRKLRIAPHYQFHKATTILKYIEYGVYKECIGAPYVFHLLQDCYILKIEATSTGTPLDLNLKHKRNSEGDP